MNKVEQIALFYKQEIFKYSKHYETNALDVFGRLLSSFSQSQLLTALFNFKRYSKFDPDKKYIPSDFFLTKKRIKHWISLTEGLSSENEKEIQLAQKMFFQYYNAFIRRDYQDQYRKVSFLNYSKKSDDIKRAACFFISSRTKMYNIHKQEDYQLEMFMYVGILFYIFNDSPPAIFQYFKEPKLFEWLDMYSEDMYSLYHAWKEWGWLNTTMPLNISDSMIKNRNERRNLIEEIENNKPTQVLSCLGKNFKGE